MDRSSALAIVARELSLKRYKPDCWGRAQRLCNDADRGGVEGLYARLRMAELLSSCEISENPADDVEAALKSRAHQSWSEGLIVVLAILVLVAAAVYIGF